MPKPAVIIRNLKSTASHACEKANGKESSMELIQYPQEYNDPKIAEEILALENTAWPQTPEDNTFPSAPHTYVTSCVMRENGMVVCHVGIRKSILWHKGEEYLAYGLSEVVTHPLWQKRGLASQLIQEAAERIILPEADVSVFTCAQERVAFYTRCGWEAMPGVCFVGGTKKKAFRSDSLKLTTMVRLISAKAKEHAKDFETGDLVFELGEGQLW